MFFGGDLYIWGPKRAFMAFFRLTSEFFGFEIRCVICFGFWGGCKRGRGGVKPLKSKQILGE